jgi:hypothetical protein
MTKHVLRKLALCSRPSLGGVVLLICLAGITSALYPTLCQGQKPVINTFIKISTQQYQTIVIGGAGFGVHPPYTGDSSYISLLDQTANPAWQAGYSPFNDTVTLIVIAWKDTKITLGGFSGAWGENNQILSKGDTVQVEVWNAQFGMGPAIAYVTVSGEAAKTTLTSSLNPSTSGEPVTFTAVITSKDSDTPPDGETVSFMQGKTLLGTGSLNGGSASFTTSTLKAGNHSIIAVYGGDSHFNGSKSRALKQVVN